MEKNKILDYIAKLQQIEQTLNGDTTNNSFIDELNSTLQSLSSEINTESISSFTLDVKVKKLSDNAVLPSYSKDGDAGMDLTITKIISETEYDITYGYDLSFEFPRGYMGIIISDNITIIENNLELEIKSSKKNYKIGDLYGKLIILPSINFKLKE